MKVIKRDGHMVDWCPEKVEQAILKANNEVEEEEQASSIQIKNIILIRIINNQYVKSNTSYSYWRTK